MNSFNSDSNLCAFSEDVFGDINLSELSKSFLKGNLEKQIYAFRELYNVQTPNLYLIVANDPVYSKGLFVVV